MIKRKLIASLTSIAMLFTTVCCGISVPVNATEVNNNHNTEVVDTDPEFYRDPETGHISIVEEEEPAVYSRRADDAQSSNEASPNTALPSKYPTNSTYSNPIQYAYAYYPPTRKQTPYGTCWAHAATACAEIDLAKNNGTGKIDLSELQLAYFHYNTGGLLPGLDGDLTNIPSGGRHYLDVGGNIYYSAQTLAQWKTYTYESTLPYGNVIPNKNYYVGGHLNGYHDGAQFRGIRYLKIKENPDSVKQAIQSYGAVYISYYSDSRYYNSSTKIYKNTVNTTTNHDIVIIGWDDSKKAWLARNSWSVTSGGSEQYEAYFWLSYEDKSLYSTAYALDFERGSTTDNLYQYDGVATTKPQSTKAAANIFTANSFLSDSNTSNDNCVERLDSVMVSFTNATNVIYRVDVYLNPTGSDPTSGKLQPFATTVGTTTEKGIYTVDLYTPVLLSQGDKFSVVVTSLNSNGGAVAKYFDVEQSRNVTYKENGTDKTWFSTTAHADKGESMYLVNNKWTDATAIGNNCGNFRIKAITSDTATRSYSINYQLNGGVNNAYNPTRFYSDTTGSTTLAEPTRKGYHFLGWYTDANFTSKATSVDYSKKYNQTYYARWCADSNEATVTVNKTATTSSDGSYNLVCHTCGLVRNNLVSYKASTVGLNYSNMTYTGKVCSPMPVIKDSKGNLLTAGTDYTYTYGGGNRTNVGRYSVNIYLQGKYSGSKITKYFNIVPKKPSKVTAQLYGYDDVKVSWSKCTGAAGYYIYYKKSSTSKYSKPKITTKTSIKISNLSDYVTYNFKVVPFFKSGSTAYPSIEYGTASVQTLKKMSAPKLSKKSKGKANLKWKSIKGASGYQVYWSAKKKGKYKKLCDYSNKYVGVSFTVGKNKTYYYKVRAYQKVGKKKIYAPFSSPKAYKLK